MASHFLASPLLPQIQSMQSLEDYTAISRGIEKEFPLPNLDFSQVSTLPVENRVDLLFNSLIRSYPHFALRRFVLLHIHPLLSLKELPMPQSQNWNLLYRTSHYTQLNVELLSSFEKTLSDYSLYELESMLQVAATISSLAQGFLQGEIATMVSLFYRTCHEMLPSIRNSQDLLAKISAVEDLQLATAPYFPCLPLTDFSFLIRELEPRRHKRDFEDNRNDFQKKTRTRSV
jgi:hypothetical protein